MSLAESIASRETPRRLKMRDLERATGVSRETIRFYIKEGLLPEPERPARNVAWYDESFVDRIHFIKELQQKRYLPLHIIRAIVREDDRPTRAEIDTLLALDGKLFPHVDVASMPSEQTVRDVCERLGLDSVEVLELAETGAIDIENRDGEQWLDQASVRIVELLAHVRQAGLTRELGFEAAQIGLYVDMVQWLVREEIRFFARSVAGRLEDEEAARLAERGLDLGNELLALLRRRMLLRYVSQGDLDRPRRTAGRTPSGRRR